MVVKAGLKTSEAKGMAGAGAALIGLVLANSEKAQEVPAYFVIGLLALAGLYAVCRTALKIVAILKGGSPHGNGGENG